MQTGDDSARAGARNDPQPVYPASSQPVGQEAGTGGRDELHQSGGRPDNQAGLGQGHGMLPDQDGSGPHPYRGGGHSCDGEAGDRQQRSEGYAPQKVPEARHRRRLSGGLFLSMGARRLDQPEPHEGRQKQTGNPRHEEDGAPTPDVRHSATDREGNTEYKCLSRNTTPRALARSLTGNRLAINDCVAGALADSAAPTPIRTMNTYQ